jgi:hypothetical protein
VRALCPTAGPTQRRCFAVLDGTAQGRILTDDPNSPGWVAVHEHSDDGMLFLAGGLSGDLVVEVIRVLRREHAVTIGVPPGDPRRGLLPAPDAVGEKRDFEDRDPAVELADFVAPPAGLRLARIDRELLPGCAWAPWTCADLETAIAHGLGYCLLDGALVVAEAFAGPPVGGVLEMAVITHAGYRRRGLAAVVCAQTIRECERCGAETWWSAAGDNLASAGLARKLGYRTERRYEVWTWFQSAREAGDRSA